MSTAPQGNAPLPAPGERRAGGSARQNPIVKFLLRHWLPIVLLIVVIVFISQNGEKTQLDFLWLNARSPLWFALSCTAVAGFLIGFLFARRRSRRKTSPTPIDEARP